MLGSDEAQINRRISRAVIFRVKEKQLVLIIAFCKHLSSLPFPQLALSLLIPQMSMRSNGNRKMRPPRAKDDVISFCACSNFNQKNTTNSNSSYIMDHAQTKTQLLGSTVSLVDKAKAENTKTSF